MDQNAPAIRPHRERDLQRAGQSSSPLHMLPPLDCTSSARALTVRILWDPKNCTD